MIPIEGLFETHISVRDLERSIAFYRDLVGLELGIVQPERRAAFFWVGGRAGQCWAFSPWAPVLSPCNIILN